MKPFSLIFLGIFSASAFSQSTPQVRQQAAPFVDPQIGSSTSASVRTTPPNPLGTPIPLPGAVPVGLEDMYQQQFSNRGLHNIIVDPDHPNKLHAAVQFAQNVTEADTLPGKKFLPQLRVYYIFSSDDGKTWSTPKAIDTARTYNHEMILMKRGTEYIPVIAAVRDYPDTNTPYYCSLYIEQGSAGTGDFKEFRTDRKTFRDSLRNLNYPSIALSHDGTKILMTAGVDNIDKNAPKYIQFSTFTLSEDGKSVTWSGWKPGPSAGTFGNENPLGFAYPWSTSIKVSPAGKVGVAWLNYDFATPDLSTYLSESTNDGATWLATPKTIAAPIATQSPVDSKNHSFFITCFNKDFWYSNEVANCVMSGFYYNRDTIKGEGLYYPASGFLMYWTDGMTVPVMLLAKVNDNDLGASVLDGTFLASWPQGSLVDPQGLTNIQYPTVARTSDPNHFSIYFHAWQEGDAGDMSGIGQIDNGTFSSYPFFGIWRVTTVDGGANFTDPEMIHGNDLNNPDAQTYDYRQIETAPWNPGTGTATKFHTLYNVDTLAGIMPYSGNPGFDDVTWLFEVTGAAGVSSLANSTGTPVINYPNPFEAQTILPFTLSEASNVSLVVTDALGREMGRTNYGILAAGEQQVAFDGVKLHAGSYPYVLSAGDKILRGVFKVLK